VCSSLCPVWLWKVCCLASWLLSQQITFKPTSNSWIVRPLTKVPVDSKKPWYCRNRVEVQHPTWAFRRGRIISFKCVYAKCVPETLNQCTRVWMLFVHISEPQVCKKKQLVSVRKQYKRHGILSKRRSTLLQNASVPEGFQKTVQQFSGLQNCTFNLTAPVKVGCCL